MSLSQGKYKPSVCAIDEVDDRNCKHDELQQQQLQQQQQQQQQTQLDGSSETAPLTNNQHKNNIDRAQLTASKDVEAQKGSGDDATGGGNGTKASTPAGSGSISGLRGRFSIDALIRSTRRRRVLYIATVSLCALLLVIIILLAAFWPEVPFYLKAELCLDKECVEASQQVLLWANTTQDACDDTYDWACGDFAREYADHDYFAIKRGEWNYKAYNEYQELNELNRFISMLPTPAGFYSVETMISSLYRSCREIDTLDKSQSDLLLKKAMNSVDGWQAFRESNRLQYWDYKKALVHLQIIYGIFPYYKISVENRYNKPHDYIISLDVGDIGLPDKYFYNIDQNDEIVRGYKLLLRDFAINMGIVSREADLFADEVFHYEKRIVNHIDSVRIGAVEDERELNEIKTLAELRSVAPSLPIFESLQTLFPRTKITDETEVLVPDLEVLHELSTVVSTSDKKAINNFIIWSLARHLLPHLSKEYRNLVETFDRAVYGRIASYPRWLVCTKIVRDWIPFAVDALQQNPGLLSTSNSLSSFKASGSERFPNKTHGNDEFLRLLYYSVRNQLRTSLQHARWIDGRVKEYIYEKLTTMRLQIGIPEEALNSRSYIEDYYNELLLNNLFFVEHLESIWSFRKARMEKKLKALDIVDNIISEMYTHDSPPTISYSNILNMFIISRGIATTQYYDYRFPIPINFARVGADIVEVLIDTISTFVEQFKAEHALKTSDTFAGQAFDLAQVDVACITANEMHRDDLRELSTDALKSFHITLSAAKITAKALSTFLEAIDSASPIVGASIDPNLTYESLGLTQRHRLPGLRSFNENELFTLAYMQKHCSTSLADKDYARIKPHVEQQLAERYLFNATWNHIQFLRRASSCSVPDVRCSNIL